MRTAVIAAVLSLIMCSPVLAKDPQDPAANIKTVSGQAEVQRADKVLPAETGAALMPGDVLRTGADGSIGISYLDGTRVSVGPSSELEITEYAFKPLEKQFKFNVYLKKGSAAYASGKLGKLSPESVTFTTPQSTVGIRGTKFAAKVE